MKGTSLSKLYANLVIIREFHPIYFLFKFPKNKFEELSSEGVSPGNLGDDLET